MARPELSLVIPIYNEEEVLPQLDVRLKELLARLALDVEVVFVNDGSRDRSIELLRRMADEEARYRVIGFSRNFGHQRAITAGMDLSRGRAVVVMDADLQDPPEVILDMVAKWREGFDVVYGRRRSRQGESWFKLVTAKLFYRLFAAMIPIEVPLDTGDFRLMSRKVVLTMRGLRETHRFVRGLVAWVGFRQTAVEYDRAARAAGETKYPLRKMLAFAIDGIASFSILPLRMATYVGVLVAFGSVLLGIAAIASKYAGLTVPGWTTTVVLLSFLFSVQFFMIGVLGEYVGRIYEQVKRRPLYVVSERLNFGRKRAKLRARASQESPLDSEGEKTPVVPRSPGVPASVRPPPVSGTPPLPPAATAGSLGDPAKRRTHPPPTPLRSTPPLPPAARRTVSKPPPPPKIPSSVANIHVALPVKPSDPPPKTSSPPPVPPRSPSAPPAKGAPISGSMKAAVPAPSSIGAAEPGSGSMKVAPASGAMRSAPASGSMRSAPASGSMKAAPASGSMKAAPASGSMKAAPASGSMKAAPASGPMKAAPASGSMKAATPSVPPVKARLPSVPPIKPSTPPAAPKPVAPNAASWDPATADAIVSSDDKDDKDDKGT